MSLNFLLRNPLFNQLVQSLEHGRRDLTVTGLTAAAKPLFLACLAQKLNRRIVYIQSSALPLAAIDEESRFYLSQFSSPLLTGTLPELAENPYLEIPPSLDAISTRMRFFYSLMRSDPALVFSNLFGLLKPFPGPSDMEGFYLELGKGDAVERERLLEMLAEFGYSREDLIASHGEYAWRGGIIDVFSPWQANPFRIELSGSQVASLREFDASTQRSLRMLDRVLIPSLREYPGSKDFVQSWAREARKRASDCGRDLQEKTRSLQGGDYFPSFVFLSLLARSRFVPFSRYLEDSLFIIDEPDEVEKDWIGEMKNLEEEYEDLRRAKSFCIPPDEIYSPELWSAVRKKAVGFRELGTTGSAREFAFGFQSVPRFDNKIPFFLQYLKRLQRERELCYIYLSNQGTRQRLAALLLENGILVREASSPMEAPERGEALLLLGGLERGFSCPSEKITFFSEKDIFTEEKVLVSRAPRKVFASQFQDLRGGDLVVHADYGIGLFNGLQKMAVEGVNREFIELLYRDNDKLLVPVEDLNLVQKFSKSGTDLPQLDKLGTNTWEKTKARTKKAVEAIAKELLDLYAERKAVKGFTFSPEGEWDADFDRIFEYEATEDQVRSIKEIMRDMESETPMDRLLCGDVGYGKTEVAMRAAFKAVMDGKQVAVLCPTTVLASQHLKTFRNRMVLFPVRIEGLTRLQTKGEQKKIVDDLESGQIDIIIGTHRLLSKDIGFRDLGLLIVDEEQRFGVNHKEKIKQMRANVDVLTLTATPIPRTLNLSLTGLRDISLIETPPRDRLSVHTVVTPFNAKLIASAIRQELNRGGQVYYLHNQIESIDKVVRMVEKIVPQSKVTSIHGKMTGTQLEKRMMDFINRKFNVLVSTTIIENGIDIPLVNTLIVDRADNFGLAQLYQLRGRVGRSSRQAFAYFLVAPFTSLTAIAKERLKALKEFSELGSGFRLAAKDLEIRGAGNLLGRQQHGSMEAVGFDYFMQLLEQAIKDLKGEKVEEVKTELNLKVDIRIPEDYLPQINLRLNLYKRMSSLDSLADIDKIRAEITDRFGHMPENVENLLLYGAVKFLAQKLKIETMDRLGNRLIIKFFPSTAIDLTRLSALLKRYSGSLTPQGVLSIHLRGASGRAFLDETGMILKELYGYTKMS